MQQLYFTVTTDLNYDQRMRRICTSLTEAGYAVTLVGRKKKGSQKLSEQNFNQKRLYCFFEKGKLFYAEFNLRLFFFLLFKKMDAICAIDLDTIVPACYISKIKKCKRIYDAHELFCEMKEVVTRPAIYKFWKSIEKNYVPFFKFGYTVNEPIAKEFKRMYGRDYAVVRNMATYKSVEAKEIPQEKYFYYQGAVNEGRSFETLIPSMKQVNAKLIICGTGNFMEQVRTLVKNIMLEEKIIFTGMLTPEALDPYAEAAFAGLTIFENKGLSNYYSLANRFFDYVQAGLPQICVGYPVYEGLNKEHEVALLINDTSEETLVKAMNELLGNEELWKKLQVATVEAAKDWNWETEAHTLIKYYQEVVFG